MPEADEAGAKKAPQTTEDYSRVRFLVADDNAFVRNIVQSMLLKNRARQITHAASGKEALDALAKSRFDCIISDWNMTPIGGLELLQHVRAGRAHRTPPDICFVLLTAHADATVVNVAISLDVNAYLVKPVSYEKLTQSVSAALQRKVHAKGPKYYEAIEGVEIAASMKAPSKNERAPAWVTWMMKSPKRAQYEERLQQVRSEIEQATKIEGNKKREIRNKRQAALADVPAGSVLAEDIYGEHGKLLISAGAVLKQHVLERLQEMTKESGDEVKLWIGDA